MISEVYNIDCMEYMRSLPDKHFDLAIADPPYGDGLCVDNQQITPPLTYANNGIGSDKGSTGTRVRTANRRNMGSEVRQKNHCVGHRTVQRVFFRTRPCLTPANYLGRKLFYIATVQMLYCMAQIDNFGEFQYGNGRIRMDFISGKRKGFRVCASRQQGRCKIPPYTEAYCPVRLAVEKLCRARADYIRPDDGKPEQPHCRLPYGLRLLRMRTRQRILPYRQRAFRAYVYGSRTTDRKLSDSTN